MHPYSYANTFTHIIFPKPTLLFVIPKNRHTHTHSTTPSIPGYSSRYLSKHRERHKPCNQVDLVT